ncbi:MAG: hypothetical protein JWL85_583 [Candidatus Saccharibacteria bacterium]|nr:hypothetical protein [Candidatus Saccharibacteria bacterium]
MDANNRQEGVAIHDGFPNAATDSSLKTLDFNSLLINHPVSTFMMRITGNEWQEHGVFNDDIAIIDRALRPQRNDLVAWWHNDAFVISRHHQVPIDAVTWGVVTSIIHQYRTTS